MDDFIKTKPYKHQQRAINFLKGKQGAALFCDMGVGKTKMVIDDINRLFMGGEINKVLIICPNSIKSTWVEEIDKHSKAHNFIHIFDVGKKSNFDAFFLTDELDKIKWLVMAVESLSQGSSHNYIRRYLNGNMDSAMVVVDESVTIKNHKATRTKRVMEHCFGARYKRILSGTPITKGMEDLYSQYYFLNPHIIGLKSFYAFRNKYCMMGGYKEKQIVAYRNENDLIEKLAPFTFQVKKEEALDLPDKIYEQRTVELSLEQKKKYKSMRDDLIAEIDGNVITATVAVTKLLRLMQIVGGFLPVEIADYKGDIIFKSMPIEGKNPKIDEVLNIFETSPVKTIIWCKFIAEIDAVHHTFNCHGINAVKAHGKMSNEERDNARHSFQDDPEVKIYVGQPEGGGMGITLTAATQVIYYSNSFSSAARQQSEDRAHRIGQTNKVTYIDVIADKTVDIKVILALRKKIDFANMVMSSIEKGEWREIL